MTSTKQLGLPPTNPYIPKSLQLVERNAKFFSIPVMVLNDASTRVWLKQDDRFLTPKGNVEVCMYWDSSVGGLCSGKTEAVVMLGIHMQLLRDYVREPRYLATLANLVDSRSTCESSLKYSVSGFSESIGRYTKEFFESLVAFHDDPLYERSSVENEKFEMKVKSFIAKKIIALKNYTLQTPY